MRMRVLLGGISEVKKSWQSLHCHFSALFCVVGLRPCALNLSSVVTFESHQNIYETIFLHHNESFDVSV